MRITWVPEMAEDVRGTHARAEDALDSVWAGQADRERKRRKAARTPELTDAQLDRMLHALGYRGRMERLAAREAAHRQEMTRRKRVFTRVRQVLVFVTAATVCVVVWAGMRVAGWK